MKTVSEIKKEVLKNSSQPQNFMIKVKREYGKTYTVKMVMGLIADYENFISSMKREGYTILS